MEVLRKAVKTVPSAPGIPTKYLLLFPAVVGSALVSSIQLTVTKKTLHGELEVALRAIKML
jgi:hypothetical protein